jgi:hypothetical protein
MWNLNKALDHLRKSAQPTSQKQCATYTRQAIEAGGLKLDIRHAAKDYGGSLLAAGFVPLQLNLPLQTPAFLDFPLSRSTGPDWCPFTSGDLAVFDGVVTSVPGTEYGHMQMFDGNQWISDFVQSRFSPGRVFDSVKVQVYRHSQFV